MYAEAWMYYLSGNFTLKQIADVLDINYTTLSSFAGRNGWGRTRAKIHKDAGKGLKEALAQRIEQARIRHQNFMLDQLDETADGIAAKVVGEIDPEDAKGEAKVTVSQKIDLIDRQQNVAAKVLKLDDIKDLDPVRLGFEFLMSLGGKPHPVISDANTGILRSNNAQLEGPDESKNTENMPVMEVIDGVARPVAEPEQNLVDMLKANGYDAHDITNFPGLPQLPTREEASMLPQPVKLTFNEPAKPVRTESHSNGQGDDSQVQSSTIPERSEDTEGTSGGPVG